MVVERQERMAPSYNTIKYVGTVLSEQLATVMEAAGHACTRMDDTAQTIVSNLQQVG